MWIIYFVIYFYFLCFVSAYLLEELSDKNTSTQNEILERISDYCGKPVTDYTKDEYEIPYTWTFYHAFFFAFTVCSTVGYGNISPTTFAGRMIMIAYSVIGIPVNGILFAGLGEYFGRTVGLFSHKYTLAFQKFSFLNASSSRPSTAVIRSTKCQRICITCRHSWAWSPPWL